MDERRKVRLATKREVVINDTVQGYALDISEGGMFIYTHIPFPVNRVITIRFTIKDGEEPINTKAIVKYVQEGVGVGVKFLNPGLEDQIRIKRFIEENLQSHTFPGAQPEGRKKVLLIDDSPTSRNVYKNKLIFMGFKVVEATDGTEALKLLHREKPDLVILDLKMEGMDGIRFLQIVRTKEEWKDIKVIVLSGRMTPQEAEKVAALGAEDILPKMLTTPNKLAERVKSILEG